MPRVPVTHAGSLIRPASLLSSLAAADRGEPGAGERYAAELRQAVAGCVRRQADTGIDVIDDGEMGKSNWISYLYERTTGLETRPLTGDFTTILPVSRDRQNFPGAYAEIDGLDAVAAAKAAEAAGDSGGTGSPADWVVTGPMTYQREAIDRDIANFKASLADAGVSLSETGGTGTQAFLPVVAPASAYWLRNEYYKTDEEFVFALADVLHEEYKAIIDSGLLLQVDDAVLMHEADTMLSRGQSWTDYRKWAELRVDALNHALRGLPAEKIRYHVCFGSWHGPHAYDPPIAHSMDLILKVNARYHLMEQANPRHEHEWRIWEDVPLPEGKVIVPGVVTHHTNVVEHPQLVAQRLVRLARLIGPENVMGGTDCGFAQGAFIHRVHEEIQWAKLASLAEGARIASQELWGARAE
ncbi:MAG: cobalamin-independent methionine synthase II family protein [Streptosporangiales bacterium]|nr:cobalamin-independent methionine synthase II family protein [Streptosporangiales bacterium]